MFSNTKRFLSRPVSLALAAFTWVLSSAMACGSSDDPGGTSTVSYGGSSAAAGASASGGSAGESGAAGVAGGPAGGVGGGISVDGSGISGDSGVASCSPPTNLCLRRVTCPNGGTTTVSGKVYIPNGRLPLYNVTVYIPNAEVTPISHGASCDRCDARLSGEPIATALTDTQGAFVLENVPVGADIPLVIQIGKWRRQVKIPNVTQCTDNPVAADLTSLPRDKAQGDMPLIALTTGDADALECLLRKIGIADSEFTTEAGTGTVNFYAGMESGHEGTDRFNDAFGAQPFTNAETFWNAQPNLMKYDVVLLSCEGSEDPMNKSVAARQNMKGYLDAGGRVFASHWHNYWVEFGPAPFPTAANFDHRDDPRPGDALIDTSFPKGQALADWLFNVGGSMTRGNIRIQVPQATVRTVNTAQRWIYNDSWQAVQYMTQNTPMEVAEEQRCGRLVLSDIHVSSGNGRDVSSPDHPFPDGCTTTDLSPEEMALIFMLFDLSACVTTDKKPPPIPS